MTKERLKELITKLTEKTGDDEEAMEMLKEINDSWGEPSEYSERDVFDEKGNRWDEQYRNMRERYIKRFYEPEGVSEEKAEEEETINDSDETVTTYDELFKEDK